MTYFLHPSEGTNEHIDECSDPHSAGGKFLDKCQEASPNSAFVVSAGNDGNLTLWDITKTVVHSCLKLNSGDMDSLAKTDSFLVEGLDNIADGMADENECSAEWESDSSSNENEENKTFAEEKYHVDITTLKPSCTIKAHQCGINALAVRRINGKFFLLGFQLTMYIKHRQ